MFERVHHQRIARLLTGLNAELLVRQRCLFGGGTAIALSRGEYRESVDVDFICSSVDGYRELRSLVHSSGIAGLLTQSFKLAREPRIDQYGIRVAFEVDGVAIKFEIVFEGRIVLDPPSADERICGVWTLAAADRVATKLMANADRWADDAVMSRDLIDLAMLADASACLSLAGVAKAEHAYGAAIRDCFAKAQAHLLERPGRLRKCMDGLGMSLPEAGLRGRIGKLRLAP